MRPKLGQHFLASERYCRRIVDSLRLGDTELIVEIGPGRGALTEILRQRGYRLVAIELDKSLAALLQQTFRGDPRIDIIHGDILVSDLSEICRSHGAENCHVIGNLPYYITSPIIERLRGFRNSISAMGLLVQREVAERIVAAPGMRDYGYLSVSIQVFAQPRVLFTIPPGAFSPPPKVQSALVEFSIRPRFPEMSAAEEEKFLSFVKICFAQKRKNLLNNLAAIAPRFRVGEELERLQIPTNSRAEQMGLDDFARLSRALGN